MLSFASITNLSSLNRDDLSVCVCEGIYITIFNDDIGLIETSKKKTFI